MKELFQKKIKSNPGSIVALIDDQRPLMTATIIEIMRAQPGERIIPHFSSFLTISNQELKIKAIEALGSFNDEMANKILMGFLNDTSQEVRLKATSCLKFLGETSRLKQLMKEVFTQAEALSLMLEHIGTEFNPVILKAFVQMMGVFPVGSVVLLHTGEIGLVVANNQETRFLLRSRIKIIVDAQGNKIDGEVVDLTEIDPETRKFKRTIVKEINADDYGLNVADYFLAQAEA